MKRKTLKVAQHVHWTDGAATTLRSLRDLLSSDAPRQMEADTPVVSPNRGTNIERSPMVLPSCMMVDSVTTPNTFKLLHSASLPPPMAVPPSKIDVFEMLMADFDPTTKTFAWASTDDGRALMYDAVLALVEEARPILKARPLLRRIHAPAYVLGDIHGNFADLHFFLRSILTFGDIRLTTNNILCLGDYVDRGEHSLECVVALISLMIADPTKVTLLRGNHEDRVVCGDKSTYGATCFYGQCEAIYGPDQGKKLFAKVTSLFKEFPLAALLRTNGGTALCTHGGFPRFSSDPKEDDQLFALENPNFPRQLTLFPNNVLAEMPEDGEPPENTELSTPEAQRAWFSTFDFMWADPTLEDDAANVDPWGFGRSTRGQTVVSFTAKAVDTFLAAHGFDMLFRAHQEKAHGIRLSKSSRVLTIFSSSNYLGHGNGAGCAAVATTGDVRLVVKAGETLPLGSTDSF